MKQNIIKIRKASGSNVLFSNQKLVASLKRSGVNKTTIQEIIKEVEGKVYDGISTQKIFQIAFKLLKKRNLPNAAKYKLKNGIMELGPSGFPFEIYVSKILKDQGYKTTVGAIVQGKCVKHEIDIIAEKDNEHFMIECKYHNSRGIVSGVKVPLYIQARFKDIERVWKYLPGHAEKVHQGWVVTNTRFSKDAKQYGACAGLHLLGWDYPKNNSLKDQIDRSGLYPITCLSTLTKMEKQRLLDNKIVLAKDLVSDPKLLLRIGIKKSRLDNILKEAHLLCIVTADKTIQQKNSQIKYNENK